MIPNYISNMFDSESSNLDRSKEIVNNIEMLQSMSYEKDISITKQEDQFLSQNISAKSSVK